MPMFNFNALLVIIPAILVAITFHEYAHAQTATLLGDSTPRHQGRLTLNPLKHLDLLGALMFVIAGFGWAKPVRVNPYNFSGDRRRGMMLVGIAGPAMNLLLAYLAAVALNMVITVPNVWLKQLLYSIVRFNVILAVFNLLPVPPLDGSKVLAWVLPRDKGNWLDHMESYGPMLLLLLVVFGIVGKLIGPAVTSVESWIFVLSSLGLR